jgi:hypothetical protein
MDRKVNVRDIDGAKLGGVDARDNATLTPGAKDSIGSEQNDTVPFEGSVSVSKMGPWGGKNTNK